MPITEKLTTEQQKKILCAIIITKKLVFQHSKDKMYGSNYSGVWRPGITYDLQTGYLYRLCMDNHKEIW